MRLFATLPHNSTTITAQEPANSTVVQPPLKNAEHRVCYIIIFSRTPEDHIERLEGVFEKLAQAGLKLKPSKCEFFQLELKYLGHIVSKQGIATDPNKIQAIQEWPRPKKQFTEVRSFTGFTNYYRKFIKGLCQDCLTTA